ALRSLEHREGLLAATGRPRLVAETSDGFLENAALRWIVVDDQDDLGHLAGYSTQLIYGPRGQTPQHWRGGLASLYLATARLPHLGKRIVSLRPALMLFCSVWDGGHS